MTDTDWLEVLVYICKKMGISVRFEKWPAYVDARVYGYELMMIESLAKMTDELADQPVMLLNIASHIDYQPVMHFHVTDIFRFMQAFCLYVKTFKVHGLNVTIVNKFFGAKDILSATSVDEALIKADLWFPGDMSEEVISFIAKKEAEELPYEKRRERMAIRDVFASCSLASTAQ